MGRFLFLILVLAAATFPQNYPWLDPAAYGIAMRCDTAGLTVPWQEYIHGTRQYQVRTTPRDPAQTSPQKYYSPVIDGTLEDNIWFYAETLLVNSWEDAGSTDACGESPKFYGAQDIHAIWRFCYNHDAFYVSAEVHDDIWDVDSLKSWASQDGAEITLDPWDWGDYAAGLWGQNRFRRYVAPSGQITAYPDGSQMCFLHLLKRANEEDNIAGLVYGVSRANYNRGDEGTNFRRGGSNLYGIDFCTKKIGVDEWGRTVVNYEFKFPYHNTNWQALEGKGYYDVNGLPQAGTLFKVDVSVQDDDIPGPDGSNPNNVQLGRRRSDPGFLGYNSNWSETKGFMTFKYSGTTLAEVVHPWQNTQPPHGHTSIAGSWVDAATESIKFDFTSAGTCIIDSTFYFYDSTSGNSNAGAISGIRTGGQQGTYTVLRPSSNTMMDTLKLTMGSNNYTLLRALVTGNLNVEGRWIEAHMLIGLKAGCSSTYDTTWVPDVNAKEFRFCPLSKIDTLLVSGYNRCADSLRVYNYANDSLLEEYTYTARDVIRGRTFTYLNYFIPTKIVKSSDASAPRNLIITYVSGGRVDTLVEIPPFMCTKIGETGNNKNQILTLNVANTPDSIKKVKFIDKYLNKAIFFSTATAFLWGVFYSDMVLCTDSSVAGYWTKLMPCAIKQDTNYLMGYDSISATRGTADSVVAKSSASVVAPDSCWLQQVNTIVLHTTPTINDTFIFRDTTHIKYFDYHNSIPAGLTNTIDTILCLINVENPGDPSDVKVITVDNYPNPFNPTTVLRIAIPPQRFEERYVLNIYNIQGQLVRILAKGHADKKGLARKIVWDGTDNLGRSVSAGVYYYRLSVGVKVKKGSMVLAK